MLAVSARRMDGPRLTGVKPVGLGLGDFLQAETALGTDHNPQAGQRSVGVGKGSEAEGLLVLGEQQPGF